MNLKQFYRFYFRTLSTHSIFTTSLKKTLLSYTSTFCSAFTYNVCFIPAIIYATPCLLKQLILLFQKLVPFVFRDNNIQFLLQLKSIAYIPKSSYPYHFLLFDSMEYLTVLYSLSSVKFFSPFAILVLAIFPKFFLLLFAFYLKSIAYK